MASRLRRTHRRTSIFVDFNHVPSGVCAARKAFETFRASRDDRVSVGAGLDHVTLFDLLVEEGVEAVSARAEGIDLTHEAEYRSQASSSTRAVSQLPAQETVERWGPPSLSYLPERRKPVTGRSMSCMTTRGAPRCCSKRGGPDCAERRTKPGSRAENIPKVGMVPATAHGRSRSRGSSEASGSPNFRFQRSRFRRFHGCGGS